MRISVVEKEVSLYIYLCVQKIRSDGLMHSKSRVARLCMFRHVWLKRPQIYNIGKQQNVRSVRISSQNVIVWGFCVLLGCVYVEVL